MYLQTEEKKLTVKPLPSEGAPAGFSGVVGELRLDGFYSREQMNYGDSFTLQVTASGNCNLDGVRNIIGGSIPGITMYETQKHTTEEIQENQYHVQKVFEVIMVPDTTGNITIEPISVPYFNPLTGKYESAEIPGTIIEVLGELSQINYGGQFKNAPVETVRITQVSYAYLDKEYFSFQIKKDTFFVILIGALAVIVLAFGLLALAKNGKKRDPVLKSLYKRLISTQESDEMYDIFNDMVKHCYRVSVKANSQSAIINSLPDNGLATQAIEIMGYMESPQFREGKGHAHLREMIKGAFKTMTNSKHTMAHHIA